MDIFAVVLHIGIEGYENHPSYRWQLLESLEDAKYLFEVMKVETLQKLSRGELSYQSFEIGIFKLETGAVYDFDSDASVCEGERIVSFQKFPE